MRRAEGIGSPQGASQGNNTEKEPANSAFERLIWCDYYCALNRLQSWWCARECAAERNWITSQQNLWSESLRPRPSMDKKLPNRFHVRREASESNIDNGAKSTRDTIIYKLFDPPCKHFYKLVHVDVFSRTLSLAALRSRLILLANQKITSIFSGSLKPLPCGVPHQRSDWSNWWGGGV